MPRNEDYIYKGDTYIYVKEDIEYGCQVIIKKVATGGKYVSESLTEKLAYDIGLDFEKPVLCKTS